MILTFAPNPALERVALVEEFVPGAPGKPMRVTTHAGGAGLRAASVIRLLGGEVLALGFVGGHIGAVLRDSLDRQDIPHVLTPTQTSTRGSFLVLDREKGVVTDIPEARSAVTGEERARLLDSLSRHLGSAELLILADDAEEGEPELIAEAIGRAREHSVPVLVDLRGDSLEAALTAGGIFLVRVNLRTLQGRTRASVRHDSAIIAEARQLIEGGVENVVVTLGEEGALLVNTVGAWRVQAPIVSYFNPTGCGQTLVGAFAYAYLQQNQDVVEALRYGCAAASVNVTHDEPGYATPGEVNILLPKTTVHPVTMR